MRHVQPIACISAVCAAFPARADDHKPTAEETANVTAALKEIGCESITRGEVEDGTFQIEANRNDGKRTEIGLDMAYKVPRKDLDRAASRDKAV